jgi:hypothetical protein
MMHWRAYLWGDRESLDGVPLKTELIPNSMSLVDDAGELQAVAGLIERAPGTFEVFLVPRDGKVGSFEVYRALKSKFIEVGVMDGVNRLIAFVDPSGEEGEKRERLAEAIGLDFELLLPSWWNGEGRSLFGRVCK